MLLPTGINISWAIRLPLGTVQGGNGVQAIILISSVVSGSMTPGSTKSPDRVVEDLPNRSACVLGGRGPETPVESK